MSDRLEYEIMMGALADRLAPLVAEGNDTAIAEVLNTTNVSGAVYGPLPAGDVVGMIDPLDLISLSGADIKLLELAISSGTVVPAVWQRVFSSGASTYRVLEAAAAIPQSFAEATFGAAVTPAEVAKALRPARDRQEVLDLASKTRLSQKETDDLVAAFPTPSEAARHLIKIGKKVRDTETVVR